MSLRSTGAIFVIGTSCGFYALYCIIIRNAEVSAPIISAMVFSLWVLTLVLFARVIVKVYKE